MPGSRGSWRPGRDPTPRSIRTNISRRRLRTPSRSICLPSISTWTTTICGNGTIRCWLRRQWLSGCGKWRSCSRRMRALSLRFTTSGGGSAGFESGPALHGSRLICWMAAFNSFLQLESPSMTVTTHSFAKINLGLCIGPRRPDGFHDLRTIYQTIALHDVIRVKVERGKGSRFAARMNGFRGTSRIPATALQSARWLRSRQRAGSSSKLRSGCRCRVAWVELRGTRFRLCWRWSGRSRSDCSGAERLRIAAEVGSDLPLFLVGGTVLGVGRGEEVYPLPDLASMPCVIATPEIAVSTPQAFADWDIAVTPRALKLTACCTLR